ncbi:MAG: hypothetical protein IKC95_03805 [Oscillospiraceae bacterium]|nr:hypothetical protein [Oscillospiraceae bacterium]
MDEQEKDQKDLEFSLEDILKEFGSESAPEAEEETAQEQKEEPTVTSTVTGDTVRLEKLPQMQGKVHNAKPILEEEDDAQLPVPEEHRTEPYSAQWEPEYEQPIAEYVPPQPIAFRPRSRLRELKKQLVAGPEKQYYALVEKGLVKIQLAIFASILVVLASTLMTAMYAFGVVPESRLRLMVFVQFISMLLSALLGSFQLLEGAADLLRKRFSLNTLLLFTFFLCCVDGVLCLKEQAIPCCAAFSLQVTMSLWSTYQRRNARMGQLDTMRKATRLDSITAEKEYYRGTKGFLRGEGQVEHFMDTYEKPSRQERILNIYALVALCVSVALGVAAGILHSPRFGIQVAAVTTLAAMPASMFITISRPMAILERRLHALGTVLCGWQGVEGLCGKAVFPLKHEDLFPSGTVQMNGVKFFGDRQPDQIIAYASALISADQSSLEPLFTHLLDSRNGMHYTVENLTVYDGGIGGEVNGEPVLVGTLRFLKDMGVVLPEGVRVNQAVCLAVNTELCGLFAITYEKDKSSVAGLSTLTACRGLKSVLIANDFILNLGFIQSVFGAKTKRLEIPESEERAALREVTQDSEAPALALITGQGFAPVAYAVTGARSVKTAAKLGTIVHMTGGILGIVMMAVLAVLGAAELLTPVNMFLYELVWMVPGLLITEWTRSI